MNEDQLCWWNHKPAPGGRWREQGWAEFWLMDSATVGGDTYCVAQRRCDSHYVVIPKAGYSAHKPGPMFGAFVDLDEAKLLCIAMNKMEGNYGC